MNTGCQYTSVYLQACQVSACLTFTRQFVSKCCCCCCLSVINKQKSVNMSHVTTQHVDGERVTQEVNDMTRVHLVSDTSAISSPLLSVSGPHAKCTNAHLERSCHLSCGSSCPAGESGRVASRHHSCHPGFVWLMATGSRSSTRQ